MQLFTQLYQELSNQIISVILKINIILFYCKLYYKTIYAFIRWSIS